MTYVQSAVATACVLTALGLPLVGLAVLECYLIFTGRPTVSDWVWDGHWWGGAAVVGWLLVGAAFLAAHFFFGLFRPVL